MSNMAAHGALIAGNPNANVQNDDDDAHLVVTNRGSKMATEYFRVYCRLLWQCEHGQQWEASLNNVMDLAFMVLLLQQENAQAYYP